MSIVVCGSVAYDTIMVFHDRFTNHILPEQIHQLNVSFLVPDMRREFGGCAGNIAYSLQLLGEHPLIVATVGDDAQSYLDRLAALGLSCEHIRHVPGTYTAQAFITTDTSDNQITAFHPGAMLHSHLNDVAMIGDATLGLVGPDSREGMLRHIAGFREAGVPFLFDPGQALPILSAEDLLEGFEAAHYCAANDYEMHLICEKTGHRLEQLAEKVEALIVTRGAAGSSIYVEGRCLEIPVAPAEIVVDPTGCGDAYRAGLLYGISRGWEWRATGQLAALMGAIKVAHRGPQNHSPDRAYLMQMYDRAFGQSIVL